MNYINRAKLSATFLLLIFFGYFVFASDCGKTAKEEYCLKKSEEWKQWKDPLSKPEIEQLCKLHYEFRKTLRSKTQESLKPLIVDSTDIAKSFCGRTFGETISVEENACKYVHLGVVREYSPRRVLQESYFPFSDVVEYASPKSHRLFKMSFYYRDFEYAGHWPQPIGRYLNGAELLKEGKDILANLSSRFGVKLQEFHLMTTVWPYRPGVKMSRAWGGPIPDSYPCKEADWIKARHADAVSTTVVGTVRIRLKLSITYYDEYSISLEISDLEEMERSRMEFEELSTKAPCS